MVKAVLFLLFLCLGGPLCGLGQDSTALEKVLSSPDRLFSSLGKRASLVEGKLDKQTQKYLSKLQRQESKLQKKLWKKDSVLAKQLFEGVEDKYARLSKAPQKVNKYTAAYSSRLDSLSTSLNFLKTGGVVSPGLQTTLDQYSSLQSRLNQAESLKKYMAERQKLLKEQLQNLGMLKELRGFQKQAYYYRAQVQQYKEVWEDPSKLEAKLLGAVQQLPQFKEFFASNSTLGSLFSLPGGSAASSVSLAGLQTRASLNQTLIDRFGSGPNVTQLLQGNLQAAQGQLSELKNKMNSLKSGSYGNSSEVDLPEGFKPNGQKTKSFLQRLEYGTNVQTGRGSAYFPVTSDLGLSLGYKLSDKNVIGVGASYKLGWGSSWNNIQLTHQGVGLRSYVDLKLKGSLFVSGGYEQNYRTEIKSIDQLKDYSSWQSSGLLGLSKKYKLKGKMKGEMKLLWDFLSYQQVPRTQAVVFRVGYNWK